MTDKAASWQAHIITLMPDIYPGPLGARLAGRALARGIWGLHVHDLRDFGHGKHRAVDDAPMGGGAGMVIRADIASAAIDAVLALEKSRLPLIALSPRGQPFTQKKARALSAGAGVILFCSRFEGLDERVLSGRNMEEISIGDYILSGGDIAAMALLDAVIRILPGTMGKVASGVEESFEMGLLEYPHYTRPVAWEGCEIPEILRSGDHQKIAAWRQKQSENLTIARRPDLWAAYAEKLKKSK